MMVIFMDHINLRTFTALRLSASFRCDGGFFSLAGMGRDTAKYLRASGAWVIA